MVEDIYLNGQYAAVMGTGLISKTWKIIHNIMEHPFRNMEFEKIIELGAGSGEHLSAVKSEYQIYYLTDLRIEPLRKFVKKPKLQIKKIDITNIDFPDRNFDRTVVSCVLSHVNEPIEAISEIHRVTKHEGYLTIYLPCEPGILLRFIRNLTTVPKTIKMGIRDPYFSHFQEHRHYYLSLNHFIKNEFKEDQINSRYYPFPFLSWNFNLFKIYQIKLRSRIDN